jgi:hypothetical protein
MAAVMVQEAMVVPQLQTLAVAAVVCEPITLLRELVDLELEF